MSAINKKSIFKIVIRQKPLEFDEPTNLLLAY